MRPEGRTICNCPAAGQLQVAAMADERTASQFLVALRLLQAKGVIRFRAGTLAELLWPDTRSQNANGQVFNLAAGIAGRLLRRSHLVREVAHGEWAIKTHRLMPEGAGLNADGACVRAQGRSSVLRTYGAATAADADLTTSTAVALSAAVPTSAQGAS